MREQRTDPRELFAALGDVQTFDREQLGIRLRLSPASWFTNLEIEATVGDEIDFSPDRLGDLLSLEDSGRQPFLKVSYAFQG